MSAARVIPTQRGLVARVLCAVCVRWLTWQADGIRKEREAYEAAGAIGPLYLCNSIVQESELRARVRSLQA